MSTKTGQLHRHGRKRIARLMRAAGLRGRTPRRCTRPTVPDPAAAAPADRIRRDFSVNAAAVNTRWGGDLTYVATWEGWLYVATVLDIASAAWSGSRSPNTCAPSWSLTRWPTPSPRAIPRPGWVPFGQGLPVHQRRLRPARRRP